MPRDLDTVTAIGPEEEPGRAGMTADGLFTNVLGWADPERGVSVGLITSGKPGLPQLWALTRRIGLEAPKGSAPISA